MTSFHDAITKLKANYQYSSFCSYFFKRDPLGSALRKYHNINPTDEQILSVISAFITYNNHHYYPSLADFSQRIQEVVKNNEATTKTQVEQIICAWVILNKNEFQPTEYINLIESYEKIHALVSCLRILDDLNGLNRERFSLVLSHPDQDNLRLVFERLNKDKLLNQDKNLDAILTLGHCADLESENYFNGTRVFYNHLTALPTATAISQEEFNDLIHENNEIYRRTLSSVSEHQPSIPKIILDQNFCNHGLFSSLVLTLKNDSTVIQEFVPNGFYS